MPMTPRRIVQCSKEGDDIRTFRSIREVCEELRIRNKEHIYRSIKYGVVAFGFRWRWEDCPIVQKQYFNMRMKRIIASRPGKEMSFRNISEASRATGASISHIQECILTGGMAKGFYFRLEGSEPRPPAMKSIRTKPVVAIDDDGIILKEWRSVDDAAKELGVIPSAIYFAISPKRPNARCKGYKLKYQEDL